MADTEGDLGDTMPEDSSTDLEDDSSGVSDDFPKVEPAPEPDNPRYSTEHEEPTGEPEPVTPVEE